MESILPDILIGHVPIYYFFLVGIDDSAFFWVVYDFSGGALLNALMVA